MTVCNDLIKKLECRLPEMCTVADLVQVGIVKHRNSLLYYRRNNMGPPFLKLSEKKIIYPKQGVLDWLKDNSHDSCKETYQDSRKIENLYGPPGVA